MGMAWVFAELFDRDSTSRPDGQQGNEKQMKPSLRIHKGAGSPAATSERLSSKLSLRDPLRGVAGGDDAGIFPPAANFLLDKLGNDLALRETRILRDFLAVSYHLQQSVSDHLRQN